MPWGYHQRWGHQFAIAGASQQLTAPPPPFTPPRSSRPGGLSPFSSPAASDRFFGSCSPHESVSSSRRWSQQPLLSGRRQLHFGRAAPLPSSAAAPCQDDVCKETAAKLEEQLQTVRDEIAELKERAKEASKKARIVGKLAELQVRGVLLPLLCFQALLSDDERQASLSARSAHRLPLCLAGARSQRSSPPPVQHLGAAVPARCAH